MQSLAELNLRFTKVKTMVNQLQTTSGPLKCVRNVFLHELDVLL